MSSSRPPGTEAINCDVDSYVNVLKFRDALEATTYDNLLSGGSISNADVRDLSGVSSLHCIPAIGSKNKDADTDILLYYLLTCDPPADVNGRTIFSGYTPMWNAAYHSNASAVKVLIDFGGDRTIKSNGAAHGADFIYDKKTPIHVANKKPNSQKVIKLLTEWCPSEE